MEKKSRWRQLCFAAVCFLPYASASWGTTIDVAGRQRMLTQRMSKEFLLVSLGIDPEGNKARMQGSITLFNNTLLALINGNADLNILAAPNNLVATGLQGVVDLWIPFADLLLSNVDTVRDAAGNADPIILDDVASRNVPLLVQSNVCVGRLVDAAKSAGAQTNGVVVDTAGRQRMLIQRMCKEAFLIASGVSVAANVNSLTGTQQLFYNSHNGIIVGAAWAGVWTLTKMCTIHQMREVSYYYGLFAPLISEILNAQTVSESLDTALRLAPDIAEKSGPLFSAMVAAVRLYVNDEGLCSPLDSVTAAGWRILILNMGNAITFAQMGVSYFLQISNGVSIQGSTVNLIVGMNTITSTLNDLIQGNKADGIEAPPTQQLVDLLLSANSVWDLLSLELQKAIGLHTSMSIVTITKVARFSQDFQTTLKTIKDVVIAQALASLGDFPGYAVQAASLQSSYLGQLSTTVNLVFFGADVENNLIVFNETKAAFLAGHRAILMGAPAADGKPALVRLSSVCAVQRMLQIYRGFEAVIVEAEAALGGSKTALETLATRTQSTYELTTTITDSYATNASLACGNVSLSYDEWLDVLVAVGDLRAYSQEASSIYLTASSAGGAAEAARIQAAKEMAIEKVQGIAYGSGLLPAPTSQTILDKIVNDVEPPVLTFADSLEGSSGAAVVVNSLDVIDALNTLQALYITEATTAFPELPALRVDAASKQILYAQKAAREAIMFIYGVTGSNAAVYDTMALFEQLQADLNSGGNGLPAIVPQRPDLSTQWGNVDVAWYDLKNWLENAGPNDVANLQISVNSLVQQLIIIRDLYKILDEGTATTFPWMFVAYGVMGFFLLMCACGAVYVLWANRKKAQNNGQGGQWAGGNQA